MRHTFILTYDLEPGAQWDALHLREVTRRLMAAVASYPGLAAIDVQQVSWESPDDQPRPRVSLTRAGLRIEQQS